ncbi:unnamed protein product [Closterium sp. NIES-53]
MSCNVNLHPTLSAPLPVRLADPSGGPNLARSSTVLLCPVVPSGALSVLHLPLFSKNLTLLWHLCLGHPSLPRLRGMLSRLLVFGLPRSLPPLPPLPALPCLPCVEGWQRAAPHSSSSLLTTALLQTLHMDVWGPARISGQGRERYFLLIVDDITRYTTVSPLRSKRRIGLVMEVIVGDVLVFLVWGSCAFVRDTSADKLSARAIPCVFLGFSRDAPSWHFFHPTSRRVFPSQDVTFDESLPFYHPLPGTAPVEVALGSGAAQGAACGGAASGGAEHGNAESEGAGSGGAEPGDAKPAVVEPAGEEPGGSKLEIVEPLGAEFEGAESEGAEPRAHPRSEWSCQRWRLCCSDNGAGGAGVTTGAGGIGGAGAVGAGAGGTGMGGAGAGGAGAVDPGAKGDGGTVRPRLYFVPLLQKQASPLPAPSPYSEQSGGLIERREPATRPASPVRTGRRVPCPRPPPVPGTQAMALRPSSVPLRVPLLPLPESFLPAGPDPKSDLARVASPTLIDVAAACRLNYATALVAESVGSESASPPSVRGECALGTDRQEDFDCLATAVPRSASMLLVPEGDLDARHISTARSYTKAITASYDLIQLGSRAS